MTRLVTVGYFWATLAAVICFFWYPLDAATTPGSAQALGFLASVPNWPEMLFRWCYVGGFLDAAAMPVVDWLLHLLGYHLAIAAVLLVVIAVLPTAALAKPGREKRREAALLPAALVCYPLCAALWSGMHLMRADQLLGRDDANTHRALQYLYFGSDPNAEDGPARVMNRLEKIAVSDLFHGPLVIEEELRGSLVQLDEVWREFHTTIAGMQQKAPDQLQLMVEGRRVDLTVIFKSLELSTRVATRILLYDVARVRNPSLRQEWRPRTAGSSIAGIELPGPAHAPIRISTNTVAPPIGVSLMANRDEVRDNFLARIRATKGVSEEIVNVLAKIKEPPLANLDPTDTVVQAWYETIFTYANVHSILSHTLGDTAARVLSGDDSYGVLSIRWHNSIESYRAAIGEKADYAGRGYYSGPANRIEFWEDERERLSHRARFMLRLLADELHESIAEAKDKGWKAEALQARLTQAPLEKGSDIVFHHELVHWALHASLAGAWGGHQLPRCIDEGLAMVYDVATSSRHANSATSELEDWAAIWRDGADLTQNPRQALLLSDDAFAAYSATNVRALYAECYVATKLFGVDLLRDALEQRRPIEEVAKTQPMLATPWTVVRQRILERPDFFTSVNPYTWPRQPKTGVGASSR